MQEHGSFELKQQGQLIIVTAYDAWNLETALKNQKYFLMI